MHDTVDAEPKDKASNPIRANATRIISAAVFIALVCVLVFSGVLADVTIDDIVVHVQAAGALGVLAFIFAFAMTQPVGVSAHIFTASAGLIWAPWIAVPIALTGAVLAACICFLFGRFVAYDWVRSRLSERLLKYENGLVDRGLRGMILIRALTYTSQPVMFMMGTTRVTFPTMLLGTIIGFIPMVCLGVFFGGELLRWFASFF